MLHGIVFGPGLGRDLLMESYLHHVLGAIERITVIDADGLWYLSQGEAYLSLVKQNSRRTILTPNVVEM